MAELGGTMRRIAVMFSALLLACNTYNYEDNMFETELLNGQTDERGQPADSWATTIDLSTNNFAKIGTIQANFRESGNYIVQFNLTPPANPGVGESFVCQAIIEWTVAGQLIQRIVTVYDGLTIQGAAKAVKVSVQNLPSPGLGVPWAVDTAYTVGVSIARGSRGTSAVGPIFQDRPEVTLCPIGTTDFVMPDVGASSVMVIANQASALVAITNAGTVDVTQVGAGGSGIYARWDPIVNTNWIPLDSNTRIIRVRVLQQTYVKIVYGIDG